MCSFRYCTCECCKDTDKAHDYDLRQERREHEQTLAVLEQEAVKLRAEASFFRVQWRRELERAEKWFRVWNDHGTAIGRGEAARVAALSEDVARNRESRRGILIREDATRG